MSKLMNLQDSTNEIIHTGIKEVNGVKVYIYFGLCNGIPTKWITQSEWDYKLSIQRNEDGTGFDYIDSKNQEILVFEQDEEEWELF